MSSEDTTNKTVEVISGIGKTVPGSSPEGRPGKVRLDGSNLQRLQSDDNIPRLRSNASLLYKSSSNISKNSLSKKGLSKLGSGSLKQIQCRSSGEMPAAYDSDSSYIVDLFGSQISKLFGTDTKLFDTDIQNGTEELKISPIARSKSSFFIHMNYGSNTFFDSKPKSSSSMAQSRNPSFAQLAKEDAPLPSDNDFLINIESKGFHGLWSNAITRLYFLQYLMWNRQENLMVLRLEIIDYRNNFNKLSPNLQIGAAKRIRNFFLSPNSIFRVDWPEYRPSEIDINPDLVIERLNQSLDTPNANTFDVLGSLVWVYLEKMHNGELLYGGKTNNFSGGFVKSPFYQSMQSDLRGTLFLTSKQYRRAIERVLCFLENKATDSLSYEKIISILDFFCLEQDFIRKDEKKIPQQTLYVKDDNQSPPSFTSSPSIISPSQQHIGLPKYEISAANHAFLAVNNDQATAFCEYCFETSTNVEEFKLYSCETCGVNIHKCCRSQMTLSCIKTSFENTNEINIDVGSEAIRIVTEKLTALQKEVDIEVQIQEGLEKIMKAKKPAKTGSKKSPFDIDIAAQLEKNTKRLDGLKHEIQKRTIQLQNIQARSALSSVSLPEEATSIEHDRPRTMVIGAHNDGDAIETGLLRVVVIDPITKMQFKKAVRITESQTTIDVIDLILSKSNIVENASKFTLSYKDSKNDEIVLKDDDRPAQIEDLNYANTLFYLDMSLSVIDDPQIKKQLDIVVEIIDSELKYTEDLKLINSIFIATLTESDIISASDIKELFININEIIPTHEKICLELSKTFINPSSKVSNLINCYLENIDQFSIYQEYCGSQHQQRELIKRLMAQNLPFSKFIQKCEQHQKLQKLGILDMLMKPMQKITRYPLLFKRLLPNLQPGTDFDNLTLLINNMEQVIFKINETVRHMESRYRIKLIDKTLEFGLTSEKFKIAIDDRQLLMENTLLYINAKADTTIEVVVLLFNDMILITRRSKKVVGGYVLYKPPIPFEQVVFIDHTEEDSKRWFQIAHLKQEIHTLQAYSVFDKKSWLQEAEAIKDRFINNLKKLEQSYFRTQATKLIRLLEVSVASSSNNYPASRSPPILAHDESFQSSYLGSFFFKAPNKKQADDNSSIISNEESQSKKLNRAESHNERLSPITKLTSEELLLGKNKLSGGFIHRDPLTITSPKVNSEELLVAKKMLRESYLKQKEDQIMTASVDEDQSLNLNDSQSNSNSNKSSNLLNKLRKKVLTAIRSKKEESSE